MKDKIEINIPNFSLRLIHIPILIGVVFVLLFFWQWNSTGKFRQENKELKGVNNTLIEETRVIKDKIYTDSLLILQNQIIIDSLIVSETKYKNQSYINRRKYERLKKDYIDSTSDDKWDIFTIEINN